jgi:cysteine desulfurase
MGRHYLDHASTSPTRPSAARAMAEWAVSTLAADPSRVHTEGALTRAHLEDWRRSIAAVLGARPREVVLTSGATEAIVSAVWGAAERGRHMVVPAVEHSAVRLSSAAHAEVTVVGCDRLGRVDPADVLRAIRPDTALVHLQWGNHEVGTTQPVGEVVAACRERGVLVHIDAAQAAGRVLICFTDLGADLMSVSAHKMGGPPGIGALLVRRGLRVRPLLVGGDQERARRAGFENTLAAAGWAAVADELLSYPTDNGPTVTTRGADELLSHPADDDPTVPSRGADEPASQRTAASSAGISVTNDEAARSRRLTDRLLAGCSAMEGVVAYGDPTERLPHIVCLGIDGVEPQGVLLGLDQAGIAAHSGSACAAEDLMPSPVLEAMGVDAQRSLRLSVGWNTTDADVDALLDALPDVLAHLRALR